MTDVIDRIKSGKAKIQLENDSGPVRVWENPPKIYPLPDAKPGQPSLKKQPAKITMAQIAAVETSQPHVKLAQLPLDKWVRITSRYDSFDACLHLGKRNNWFCDCDVCGARTYRVLELHRKVTLGINEQRYEHEVYRETWGQTCLVCGWNARKRSDGDYGGWNTILNEVGIPDSSEYRWTAI